MGQELGRISGVMLKDNLERQGADLSVDDTLLYLDVTNKSIGINTSATDAQTALIVNSTFKTTNLFASALKLPTLTINTPNANTISSTTGNLYLNALGSIISPNIRTDDLNFDDNIISSTTTNQSIELRPHGSGTVEIPTDLNVTGDIFATGDILIDGTIVFGNNSSQDQVNVAAGVNSNFLPTLDNFYSLGENPSTGGNRWLNSYASSFHGQTITTGTVQSGGVDLTLRPGKIWFVSKNGSDSNYGNHQASAFLTIKQALLSASAGDEILIYPGTYAEIMPLTVPAGVTVKGTGIRSVNIIPTVGTNNKDVFLLNGETTISDLTVKDFYYNSSADTGYAFRFASDFRVSTRSPYIQNVSVITKETTAGSLDAGRGALVDGAVVNTATKEASMLFTGVTMIVPNADALTMTNGVRVEWLNCFSYFANKGFNATTGTGRYDANLSVTRYGAELRSIGSATVYGTYGAYASGPNTLLYLIDHNFAYIGSGTTSLNDPSLNNHTNEVVEIGGGKIYYQSLDNKGNFYVGDAFSVDAETGNVQFNGVGVTAQGVSSINFSTGGQQTKINSLLVSTGNVQFAGNTVSSTYGDVNLLSPTNKINLTQNVSAKSNVAIDNNFSLKGTLTLGDQLVDMTEFKADTSSSILPSANRIYSLGNDTFVAGVGDPVILPGKRWNKVINQLSVIDNNIQIFDNVIQTTLSNADLELRTHSSGKILLENNELLVSNQLTVNGTSTTKNVNVTGYIHQTGSTIQTGNRNVSNGAQLTGNISATVQAAFETITVSYGSIATTMSNADLELRAAGSGQVVVPVTDVQIQNNLNVLGTTSVGNAAIINTLSLPRLNDSDIIIFDNQIATTGLNHNLLLEAHSVGKVIGASNVEITNKLTVDGLSTLANTVINGTITHTGTSNQTGNTVQTGNYNLSRNLAVTQAAYFNSITIVNNQITTVNTNSDLELRAAGSGKVLVNDNLTITNNLRVVGNTTTNSITNSGTVTADTFTEGNIVITQNYIATTVGNDDLILSPNLSGTVTVATNGVLISNDLSVTGTSTLGNTVIGSAPSPALLTHTGTSNQTGNTTQTGDYFLSNNLTVTQAAYFNNVTVVDNAISTSVTNSDLELRAATTGRVVIDDVFRAAVNLQVDGLTTTNGLTNSGTITSDKFSDGNILISNNYITTTTGDLTLIPNNNGLVSVAVDNVLINNNLQVDGTSTLGNTVVGVTRTTTSIAAPIVIATPGFYSDRNNDFLSPFTFVSSSGNYAIIGQSDVSSVKIYNVTTGQLIHTLSDPAAGSYWGQGVAIDGNYAVVTDYVPRSNGLFPWYTSAISVFDVTTGNLLRSIAVDPNAGTGLGLELGPCIDISGNYAILGGRRRARIYDITTGNLVHILTNPIVGAIGWFGRAVAILGNYAIVGDPEALSSRGVAYIFDVTTGLLIRTINSPSFQTTNLFGGAVSTDGTRVIIGAPRNNTPASQSGIAYIFDVATGNLVHTLVNPNLSPSADFFGSAVSLDGNYAVVGAYNTGFYSGAVYLFNVTTGNLVLTWDNPNIDNILSVRLSPPPDFFGTSISLSGNTIIAGGGGDNGGTTFITSILAPNPATLTVTGPINRTGNVTETGNYTLSNNLTVSGTVSLANIDIDNNVITTTDSNSDLELRAASAGRIYASYGNVAITNDLRINGITTTTSINNSGIVYSDTFKTTNLIISQNLITSQLGTNIKLTAAGLGNITLPKITFDNNSIKATALNDDINLTVSAGSITIPSTNALKIPSGTTAARGTNTVGDIRLNTSDTLFLGWNGARVTFGGLFSTDRRTTVLAHPTNNTINFVTNNTTALTLAASGLTLNALLVDNNLQFTGNTISSTANSNIVLAPNAAGKLKLGNLEIDADTIQNVDPTSSIIVQNTGYGYVQFGGTKALGLPAGTTLERPINPNLGDFRFNTTLSTAEVFNGIEYVTLGGGNTALLNATEIAAITDLWGLILG